MNTFFTDIVNQLIEAGIDNPRLETRLMLAHIKQCPASEVYSDIDLDEPQQKQLKAVLNRRLNHEPLDKILGTRSFFKYDFKVNTDVLSPRPDTETLVESVLEIYSDPNMPLNLLDLGTGSGCIIESLLAEYPNANGLAVDISAKALSVARQNAENLGLVKRLNFLQADWFAHNFVQKINRKFEVIVTNPPYIPTADITKLDKEVKNFDPLMALDGGADGFSSYRRLAEVVPQLLTDGGYVFIEAGIGQAEKIAQIFTTGGLRLQAIKTDLSGIQRCVILQNNPCRK